MNWSYAYSPSIWPSILAVFLMLGLAFFSSRRSSVPGAIPLMLACLFGAAWAAGSVMEYAATDLAGKIFWVKFQTVFQLPAASMITCFILEYAWPGRWLTRRNLALLSIVPLLVLGMILLDNRLHWIWTGFKFDGTVAPQLAPGGWLAIVYSFVLVILNLIALTWLFRHSPQHRWVVVVIIIGQVGVRTLYILEKADLVHSHLPLDVIGLAFIVSMYGIALFGFRIFDPIPLARRTVIEQLRDGVLVLDPAGRVAGMNKAAEYILGIPLKQVKGKLAAEILPGFPRLGVPLSSLEAHPLPGELKMGRGVEARSYEFEFSPLNDFHGLPVGYLLLLHDVSEQRRSQSQILEQQRALAMLTEREQLARELHDELAQGLALINIQAQLVCGLLEAGQQDQAQAQLQVLAKAARDAQFDVRGEIGMLSYHMDRGEGFLESLRHFTQTFQEKYGIQTEFYASEDMAEVPFAPTLEAQLFYIIQEVFTNIRKHARAKRVQVSLTQDPECILLEIEDDGVGFDPEEIPASQESFGQGIMTRRAAEVGGHVEVISSLGKGTKVTIEVPLIVEAL